ncbi:hypothetical protein D5F01_LYC00328 [Larimichthys crocea]|uniref:Uncharacterized protein n=1 Tax=Larimichthys crocea TaxID=215358 RepID=A0A6G0J9Q1_LARCR|nr:hypothetical protein D5F01_LYC00328 [Larimichthys crocea]
MLKVVFVLGFLLSLALAQPMEEAHKRLARSSSDSGSNEDEKFQPGDDEQSVTQAPEDGDEWSGGNWPQWNSDHPVWTHEMPPGFQNRPTGRPGNGNPREPMKGTDRRPGRPQGPPRGKRQFPGFASGVPHPGPMGHSGRPSRGNGRPNKNPSPMQYVKLIYNSTEPVSSSPRDDICAYSTLYVVCV